LNWTYRSCDGIEPCPSIRASAFWNNGLLFFFMRENTKFERCAE
jgi:hypothetical protein